MTVWHSAGFRLLCCCWEWGEGGLDYKGPHTVGLVGGRG